jgi:superfamily II DNA or RNA helicase
VLAEHQRDAVERALALLETRGGVLLADDVGLGKSFVAAEVMRRWSQFATDLELILPAALVPQWRATLAQFGIEARVLTHDGICGDPYLPRPSRRLVVVDEAHAFRNPLTRRYAALARRCAGARVLLVTATPVCNSIGDLEALLRLIARDDLLADAGVPSIDVAFERRDAEGVERIVAELVIRRDRSVLPVELRFGALDRRVVRHPVLALPRIDELRFPLVGENGILRRFLRRRLESSEAAFIESVRRQLRFYDRALAAIRSGRELPKRDYRRAFAHEEDRDALQEVLFWELFAPAGDGDPAAIREEMERLESLLAAARASPCEKRGMLVGLVRGEREPMLIFTGSAATAGDLRDAIGGRCGLVTSRERSREAVLHAFTRGALDVVVSTDMAAEGLNLQRAGVVVHYDIPWNPVKLDQRNGRAHRIGQQRESVRAIYFLPESRETGIVETIARKNRMRKRALQPAQPATRPSQPTLRPRVTRHAAFTRLHARDAALPELLARRHRAGIEQIIEEMSREYLDQRRIDDLVALVAGEV